MSLALRPAETSTRAIWWDGVFKRYKGVLRLEVNVLGQAGPRNVCLRSVQPCLPSPKRRVDSSIIAAKVRALLVRTGEAFGVYPSGALPGGFSPHSRDAASVEAVPPPNEGVEPRRQAGQSSGERGFRRQWSGLRFAPPRGGGSRRRTPSRHPSLPRERRRHDTS